MEENEIRASALKQESEATNGKLEQAEAEIQKLKVEVLIETVLIAQLARVEQESAARESRIREMEEYEDMVTQLASKLHVRKSAKPDNVG